jgi:hypothetical protein
VPEALAKILADLPMSGRGNQVPGGDNSQGRHIGDVELTGVNEDRKETMSMISTVTRHNANAVEKNDDLDTGPQRRQCIN